MFLKHLLNTYSLSYRADKEETVVFSSIRVKILKPPFFIMEHLRGHYNVALLFCLKVLENAELKAWKALQVSIEYIKLKLLLHVIMKTLAMDILKLCIICVVVGAIYVPWILGLITQWKSS